LSSRRLGEPVSRGSASGRHLRKETLTKPAVTIAIVNWNSRELTRRCLETLGVTNYVPFEVVLIDNGSTDGSVDMIQREFSWVRLIRNTNNLGYPRAVNQGITYAISRGAKYMFIMNNDIEFLHQDWLTKLVSLAEDNSAFGVVGPKLLSKDGETTATTWIFRKWPFTYLAVGSDKSDAFLKLIMCKVQLFS
jgi:GT2 family glycosyltransferase